MRGSSNIELLNELGIDAAYGDVTDKGSLKKAIQDVGTVIHLVGIIIEHKGATFEIIHKQGTMDLVNACKETGVRRFIYISSLGARENARSRYHRTKWEAERAVIDSGMEYIILRPSIMIGEGGEFITMLLKIVRSTPIIPIIDGESKMQPIYVENTVDCVLKSLTDLKTTNRIFEIAGPEQMTYKEFFLTLMEKPPITIQQLIMLQEDNICDIREMQEVFNPGLVPFKEGLKTFLPPKGEKINE